MEYYRILNLVREPFSNSPEPEFFFQSPKHVSCLQKLELAIRLRRGLSVVMGHVGTGKTTLCRHLIRQFATANEEADAVETYLLMDPAFSTPQEFLSTIAIEFGIAGKRKRESEADTDPSEWQLKEHIKTYLFKKGVDEKKVVALIIDEGQKLPDFCLEILREFLNYETNENKLLQIIIFGQEELQLTLNRLPNLADRVNLHYLLEPLNYKETRDMIRFRIARAAEPGQVPTLFTWPGLLAVYLATRGYPRKIITLCHQSHAGPDHQESVPGRLAARAFLRRPFSGNRQIMDDLAASLDFRHFDRFVGRPDACLCHAGADGSREKTGSRSTGINRPQPHRRPRRRDGNAWTNRRRRKPSSLRKRSVIRDRIFWVKWS